MYLEEKMEQKKELWNATEANKFIYKKLKEVFIPLGFVVCPKVSKYLMRVCNHHVQIVYQQILYGETRLHMIVIPTWTYADFWFFNQKICLRSNNVIERIS